MPAGSLRQKMAHVRAHASTLATLVAREVGGSAGASQACTQHFRGIVGPSTSAARLGAGHVRAGPVGLAGAKAIAINFCSGHALAAVTKPSSLASHCLQRSLCCGQALPRRFNQRVSTFVSAAVRDVVCKGASAPGRLGRAFTTGAASASGAGAASISWSPGAFLAASTVLAGAGLAVLLGPDLGVLSRAATEAVPTIDERVEAANLAQGNTCTKQAPHPGADGHVEEGDDVTPTKEGDAGGESDEASLGASDEVSDAAEEDGFQKGEVDMGVPHFLAPLQAMWRLVGDHGWLLGGLVLLVSLSFAADIIMTGVVGQLFDVVARAAAAPRSNQTLREALAEIPIKPFVMAFAGILLKSALRLSGRFAALSLEGKLQTSIQRKMLLALLVQDTEFFDRHKVSNLMERVRSDTYEVAHATVNGAIVKGVGALIQLFVAAGYILVVSPEMATSLVLLVPPAIGMLQVAQIGMGKAFKDSRKSTEDAAAFALETVSGMRTIRQFVAEHHRTEQYDQALDTSMRSKMNVAARVSILSALAAVFEACGTVSWLLIGAFLCYQGTLSIGRLSNIIQYAHRAAASLSTISSLQGSILSAGAAAGRICSLLDIEPVIEGFEKTRVVPSDFRGRLEMKNVHFSYPTRVNHNVLSGLSLVLEPGKSVALVGQSGSGKSTAAQLLQGLYRPSKGNIFIDGVDISEVDLHWLRANVGVVSQEPVLFYGTIEENIRLGKPSATHEEVVEAARQANALEFITSFPDGIHTRVGDRGTALSGGQKQRIAIARAILKDPKVLILDEATSALDTTSERTVQDALDRLMEGRTVLVIAHRLSTIKDCDTIMVLANGQVVESGSHDTLMKSAGVYANMLHSNASPDTPMPSPPDIAQEDHSRDVSGHDATGQQ